MKQTITFGIFASLILCALGTSAQKQEGKSVNIGLVYPISSNGLRARQCSNVLSLNALGGISRSETGTSIAGLSNIVLDSASGLQIAGLYNLIGNHARGLQIAGLMNKSGDANVQIAGFLNIAKKVRGLQIAGFINIADSSDYPIGIINLIRNGEKSFGFSVDETRTVLLSFRSGGRKLYGILGLGYNDRMHEIQNGQTKTDALRQVTAEAGIGAHWNLTKDFRVNTEILSMSTTDFNHGDYQRSVIRILPSLHNQHFELFAGPTFNYAASDRGIGSDLISHYAWSKNTGAKNFQGLYFAAMAGFAYRF